MGHKPNALTAAEKAALKQRVEELNAHRGVKGAAKAERERQACLDVIAALEGADREVAEGLHALVTEVAPALAPKTWYGFPSYARDGKVVVFFQPASKFGTRYGTIGFNDAARLDDGAMWPTSYAVTAWMPEVAVRVRALLERA